MSAGTAGTGWQRAFAAALLDPTLPPPEGLHARGGTEGGGIARRFAVYRNNVVGGLVRALAERFPVVQRLVGEPFFAAMARGFMAAHPPGSPVLFRYGEAFPGFIAGFAPAGPLPYLADVARLEAARGRAFHAADVESLARAAFSALRPDRIGRCRIRLHPSVQLLASAHPVVSIWRAHQGAGPLPPVARWEAEYALVWRLGGTIELDRTEAGQAAFLRALADGRTVATAARAGLGAEPGFDLAAALHALMAQGLAATLHTGPAR